MTRPSNPKRTTPEKTTHWLARVLVCLQFALAAAIVLGTAWTDSPSLVSMLLAGVLWVVGSGTAMWAWWVMGLRRLRVMPHPAKETQLLQHGPYRWIRHPMYAGLLVAALGCVTWDASLVRGGLWLGLGLVLVAKTGVEEKLLCERFTEYPLYRTHSWRFLPGVW